MLYRDQGVVLRSIKLGETDRIVTVLARGHGKIRAVAKGVRKPGSRFGARSNPPAKSGFRGIGGAARLNVARMLGSSTYTCRCACTSVSLLTQRFSFGR